MTKRRNKTAVRLLLQVWAISVVLVNAGSARAVAEGYIAGTTPSVRPPGAPRIEHVVHTKAWFGKAYKGIEKPYPPHLGFIQQQGDWYTPFNHPGMTGLYDIRGWHEPGGD